VDLEVDDEEQMCADPDGKITDGEAAELAIIAALGNQRHEAFVFGPNIEPAMVFREYVAVNVEGEE
jgi:hypothetical protein